MNIWALLVGTLFCIVCVLLLIIILLQRGRGVGLAGAFGGAGGQSAFGAKTGDVFTWVTVALTGVFLFLAVIANYVLVPEEYTSTVAEQQPGTAAKAPQDVQPKKPGTAAPSTTQPTKP